MENIIDKEDLCQQCKNYWQDFPIPLDNIISHCSILDKKASSKDMDDVIPYPCVKCPFDSFIKK